MLRLTQDRTNHFQESIDRLRITKKPIALFGAGEVANRVYDILSRHDLAVEAVFTDTGDQRKLFHGMRIQRIGDSQDLDFYQLVAAIGNYRLAKNRLSDLYGVTEVTFIENVYDLPPLTFEFIENHKAELSAFSDSLQDEESAQVLTAYLNSRATENARFMFSCDLQLQYFPRDIPNYLPLSETAELIDCGAYTGDTIVDFTKITDNRYGFIYAFEPDSTNFSKLERTAIEHGIRNIKLFNGGVGASDSTAAFLSEDIASRVCDHGSSLVSIHKLDNAIGSDAISLIKMDIEGAELDALKGAANIISNQRPRLAISIYHKPEDLVEIPAFLRSLAPDYRFYLRAHKSLPIDVVLYAIP